MQKAYVRSYRVNQDGDLEVFSLKGGEHRDLSKHYEDLPRNRHALAQGAFVDVFRQGDGDLTWVGSPGGHSSQCALSMKLLLDAYTQDLLLEETKPRAF